MSDDSDNDDSTSRSTVCLVVVGLLDLQKCPMIVTIALRIQQLNLILVTNQRRYIKDRPEERKSRGSKCSKGKQGKNDDGLV